MSDEPAPILPLRAGAFRADRQRRQVKPRLGVVEIVYHQLPDAQPTSRQTRFFRWLDSAEEPYRRTLTLRQGWVPLECGWVQSPGLVFLDNQEGRFLQVQPSESERQEAARRVVEVGLEAAGAVLPFAAVHPGESARFQPADAARLRLRCRHESARVLLLVLPS